MVFSFKYTQNLTTAPASPLLYDIFISYLVYHRGYLLSFCFCPYQPYRQKFSTCLHWGDQLRNIRLCTSSAPNSSKSSKNSSAQEKLKFYMTSSRPSWSASSTIFPASLLTLVIHSVSAPEPSLILEPAWQLHPRPLARSCPLPGTVCLWIPAPVLSHFPDVTSLRDTF